MHIFTFSSAYRNLWKTLLALNTLGYASYDYARYIVFIIHYRSIRSLPHFSCQIKYGVWWNWINIICHEINWCKKKWCAAVCVWLYVRLNEALMKNVFATSKHESHSLSGNWYSEFLLENFHFILVWFFFHRRKWERKCVCSLLWVPIIICLILGNQRRELVWSKSARDCKSILSVNDDWYYHTIYPFKLFTFFLHSLIYP